MKDSYQIEKKFRICLPKQSECTQQRDHIIVVITAKKKKKLKCDDIKSRIRTLTGTLKSPVSKHFGLHILFVWLKNPRMLRTVRITYMKFIP